MSTMVGRVIHRLTVSVKLSLAVLFESPCPSSAVPSPRTSPWKFAGGVKLNGALGSTTIDLRGIPLPAG